jgi:preprotein translocase subunit SecF
VAASLAAIAAYVGIRFRFAFAMGAIAIVNVSVSHTVYRAS